MTDQQADPFVSLLMAQVNAKVTEDALRAGVMTLGSLRTALSLLPPSMPVEFDGGGSPADIDSYRGYYERLALSSRTEPTTAGGVIALLDTVDGETLQGYKGGDFYMDAGTFIHAAEYGCTGPQIVGLHIDGDKAVIETAEEIW